MTLVYPDQFLGLPPCGEESADAIVLPLPMEMTVSYGTGTWRAPRAILEASCQVEVFDEETLVDFSESPKVLTLPPFLPQETPEHYLRALAGRVAQFRNRFVLGLGGEHTLTYGLVTGLVEEPAELTIVQIDAHADLIDELDGRRWSHGTVMRRLWEQGCRLVQIGLRSLSRSEYGLATGDDRIMPYFAHQLPEKWPDVLDVLHGLRGDVYLTVDLDGLDPSVIPSTGTPQPNGLSWPQAIEVFHAVSTSQGCRLLGADVVELVASPHPPGCDLTAAKLVQKLLAFWWMGKQL